MFKKFWFYFNAIPVAFSILFFSINLLFVWGSDYQGPAFADAVEECKDVSNDTWADDEKPEDNSPKKYTRRQLFMKFLPTMSTT